MSFPPFPHPMLGRGGVPLIVPASTLDPAFTGPTISLSAGNLRATHDSTATWQSSRGTISRTTGKFYCEVNNINLSSGNAIFGIVNANASTTYLVNGVGYGMVNNGDIKNSTNAVVVTEAAWAGGAGCRMAVDIGAGLIWLSKIGGVWNNNGAANPATGVGGLAIGLAAPFWPALSEFSTGIMDMNFGPTFLGAVPAGFSQWP